MRNEQGFTFPEVIITAALFLVITLLLAGALLHGIDFWELGACRSDLQSNGQRVMNIMLKEFRNATRTRGSVPPDALILPPPNNTGIQFYLPVDIDGDGTIIDAVTGETEWNVADAVQYHYDPGQGQLQRIGGGVTSILANNVTAVQFEDWNINGSLFREQVRITLQMQKTTSRQRIVSVTFISLVNLRN